MKVFAFLIASDRHSERRGQGCRSMARTERVVFGFVAPKKARKSLILLYRVKLIAPAGEYFMGVCLVSHVPYKTVARRVENVVHRNGQLDGTERRPSVTAHPRTGVDNELANLVGDLLQVLDLKLPQIGW
jgi:hypothetical protein